eukprot:jgi/Psemu1/303065/fgenesh1_kg.90_\
MVRTSIPDRNIAKDKEGRRGKVRDTKMRERERAGLGTSWNKRDQDTALVDWSD